MKAFLLAVVAWLVISVAAGYILVSQQDTVQSTRVAEDVRLR